MMASLVTRLIAERGIEVIGGMGLEEFGRKIGIGATK
jgi:hypothetical protein